MAFCLLFEHEFDKERSVDELYDDAKASREVEENKYVRTVLRGVAEHEAELESAIGAAAHGWALSRISKVSLAVLKLSMCEMQYMPEIPLRVSLNEALELVKRYDEEEARPFVNGILNTALEKAKEARPDEA